jgi:hypothetical protein
MDTLSHAAFTRPVRPAGRGRAGLGGTAVLPLALLARPAKASTHRGIVGVIKPRATDSSLVDMIKLLPEGIGVIPVYLNLTQGSREEYASSFATYERHISPHRSATSSRSKAPRRSCFWAPRARRR